MTVYQVVQRIIEGEREHAGQYADQYLTRLEERHPDAEVSCRLGRKCIENALALEIVLKEMPVEVAEREV